MEKDDLFDFEFDMDENGWSVTDYYGRSEEVVFPASYEGKPVKTIGNALFPFSLYNKRITRVIIPEGYTSIGESAFQNCLMLTEIRLPESLTSIGKMTFQNCFSLKEIQFPKSLTSIGESAFQNCLMLTEIRLPEGLTSIKERTFQNCDMLTEIRLPESLTSIGDYAFFNCRMLTNIKLPENLASIGEFAFAFCAGLINIIVDENNPVFRSLDGVLFDKDMTTLMWFPDGKKNRKRKYSVPEGIIAIDSGAFYHCKLTSICFPKSLLFYEKNTFKCKQLKSITVSELNPVFSTIDGVLFDKEKSVLLKYPGKKDKTDYTVPDGIISIECYAFCDCKYLINIVLPESLEFIGDYAFSECKKLASITLPISLQYVGRCVFENCSHLETITLSRKTRIWHKAFEGFTGQLVYRD